MHFGHNNVQNKYTMEGQELEKTKEERDIGVLVSNNLKPSAQCSKAATTAGCILGQIARSFHYRDRHIFMRLYKQYVLPHLEFSVAAWSPWTEADKNTLEKVQIRAVRMVSGLRGKTYEEKLAELGMTTLEERRHVVDMVQVFKIVHKHDNVDGAQWFQHVSREGYQTRAVADPLNLVQNRSRLDLRRNFFSQRVIEHWNRIPASLKMAANVEAFKRGYKKLRKDMVNNVVGQ